MKKILFANPGNIITLKDTYSYCMYLRNDYDITYLGIKENKPDIDISGVDVIHIVNSNNSFKNKIIFIYNIYKLNKSKKFDFIFINYFKGVSLINLLNLKNVNIDIRTGYINRSFFKRLFFNKLLKFELIFFKKITVISNSLKIYLNLPDKSAVLPLGADRSKYVEKQRIFKLLYVGTFYERNISITIIGFYNFLKENNLLNNLNYTYTIIGFGTKHEINEIKKTIKNLNAENQIYFNGEIRGPLLSRYFETHTIGVSFIPLNNYFNFQPPTKTYEYLINGLVVVGTNTFENNKIINKDNGILINDDYKSFSNGIQYVYQNFNNYDFNSIRDKSLIYSWDYIISHYLIPIIEKT